MVREVSDLCQDLPGSPGVERRTARPGPARPGVTAHSRICYLNVCSAIQTDACLLLFCMFVQFCAESTEMLL